MTRKPTYKQLEQRVKDLEKETLRSMQTEKALRESAERLLDVAYSTADWIWEVDKDGVYTYCSDRAEDILGYSSDEIVGRTPFDLMPQDEVDRTREVFLKIVNDKNPIKDLENWNLTKDGKLVCLLTNGVPFFDKEGNFRGYRGVTKDITEQKRTEVVSQEREEKFHIVSEFISDCIYWRAPNKAILYIAPVCEKITGYMADEFYSSLDLLDNLVHPDDRNLWQDHSHLARADGSPMPIEFRIVTKHGETRWMSHVCRPVYNEAGKFLGVCGSHRDITDLKGGEEALRQSEKRYRNITEAVTDYVFSVRIENGHPVETVHSTASVAVTGYTIEDFSHDPYLWFRMVHEEDHESIHDQIRKVLSGEEVSPVEHRIYRKDDVMRWVRNTLVPHYDQQGNLTSYDGLVQDITEQRNLLAKLYDAQKMEAVGILAGGMAHDFNNLLMAIQGNVSLMLYDISSTSPFHGMLKSIEKQVRSGARLTRQLLGYARRGQYDVKPIDLNELLEGITKTFARTKKQITVHKELCPDLYAIEADEGQIEQVILNLLINAADAMPGSGQLTLKTININDQDIKNKIYEPKPGNYVLLTVSDTGVGIDEETQKHIFEPFFTTKQMGRGTGLGLASAYGIVKGHGGYIDVESELGRGTIFSIYLRATEETLKRAVTADRKIVKGNETILVVDDEEMVLDTSVRMLKKLGYTVLEGKGGKQALEIYEKQYQQIDLVVLDMVMPDIGGGEAYDRMKEIKPSTKVLLCSGYSMNSEAKEIMARGCHGFIAKPFSIHQLSKSIGQLLEHK